MVVLTVSTETTAVAYTDECIARTQRVNSATQYLLRAVESMEDRPDLTTRGGRIQHVRESLATRYGNLSYERFGKYVGAAQAELLSRDYKPYKASTAMRWEAGADINSDALYSIARLGGVVFDWLVTGTGPVQDTTREPVIIAALPATPPKPKKVPKTQATTIEKRTYTRPAKGRQDRSA